jgi:hypothetical protein
MLTMALNNLPFIDSIDNVEIHSFDASIYTARLFIDGLEYRLIENNQKPYQRRSAGQIKKDLKAVNIKNMMLVHSSPYDEMVGQPVFNKAVTDTGNTIRVPLNVK